MEENQEKKLTKEKETKENPNQEQNIEVKNEEQHILEKENKSETSLVTLSAKNKKKSIFSFFDNTESLKVKACAK